MSHPLPTTPTGVDAEAWAATVGAIRAYCNWHIAPEVTETVTVDGHGGWTLFLPTLRLVDLVSVTNDGTAVTDPQWSATGMVRRGDYGGCWTHKLRGIVAEITHGYEEWPADLLQVATDMLADTERGVTAMTSGPYQVRYEQPLSSRQRAVLERYTLVALA